MDSKNLLILLVALFLYINLYQPTFNENEKESSKLATYKQRLALEENFLQHKKDISNFIEKSNTTIQKNDTLLYKANLQDSIIFNKMQSKIKKIVQTNKAKLLNIIWGEPYSLEDASYTNMPFTFILEIEPTKLHTLLKELFLFSSSITIKQMFVVKKKDILVVNMQIYLHKNKKETQL